MADQPVSSHYMAQTGLAIALTRALRALWPTLDVQNLSTTMPDFKVAVMALTQHFALASATLASRDYMRRRVEAGITGGFTVPMPDAPPFEQVDKSVEWAVRSLWNPDVLTKPATDPAVAPIIDATVTKLEGAVEKMVLDTGRQTMVDAVNADRKAHIWAREARPDCCYFCAMLAGRGAVYSSAQAAGEDNAYHDHCRCQVVPVFGKYEPTAHARQWSADWQRLADELGHAPSLSDWRQHYDGQTGDSHSPGASGPVTPGGQSA